MIKPLTAYNRYRIISLPYIDVSLSLLLMYCYRAPLGPQRLVPLDRPAQTLPLTLGRCALIVLVLRRVTFYRRFDDGGS